MNKLNDIFKKIAKMEQNAQEVKLGKHEVKLAMIDDLVKLVNQSRDVSSEMTDNYLQAKKYAEISINAAKQHLKNLESVYVLVNNIRTQGDALGVDVTKIQEWRRADDFLNGNPKGATEVMIKKMQGL
jgi:hypothetical protein